jgi:hypothetical protein
MPTSSPTASPDLEQTLVEAFGDCYSLRHSDDLTAAGPLLWIRVVRPADEHGPAEGYVASISGAYPNADGDPEATVFLVRDTRRRDRTGRSILDILPAAS